MPLVEKSSYKRPYYLFNRHLETIVPSLLRKVELSKYERERLITSDDDFLDLDWLKNNNKNLVIISHGLEGSSDRPYVKGMAKAFYEQAWDVLAWNCRSCSGEMNKAQRMYHHAASDDLEAVVKHAIQVHGYEKVVLVGFSMGGSLTVKYLGEQKDMLPKEVYKAVVFSVPCNLGDSARELSKAHNSLYRKRFLKKLGAKIKLKAQYIPDLISYDGFEKIQHFPDFDNRYTAPLHGFKDADDFYEQASANYYLPHVTIPILLVNALNDPMLPESCYPIEIARNHPNVFLEIPKSGGHVGFGSANGELLWSERRAVEFVEKGV